MKKRILCVGQENSENSILYNSITHLNGFEHLYVNNRFRAQQKINSRKYHGLVVFDLEIEDFKYSEIFSTENGISLLSSSRIMGVPSIFIENDQYGEANETAKDIATRTIVKDEKTPMRYFMASREIFLQE